MGGFTMYVCLRLGELLHRILSYFYLPLFIFGIRGETRARVATLTLIPYQLISLVMIFLFDRFSPRDARGWIVLATRRKSTEK